MTVALNDETIGRKPTFATILSICIFRAIAMIMACILFVVMVIATISALVLSAVLLLIFSPIILLGMEW